MKILMLLNAYYPDDIRVSKEARSLISAGMEVHLLCRRNNSQPADEKDQGLQIHRIHAGHSNYSLAVWDIIVSMTRIHPRFKRKASELHQQFNFDAFHVHDLPLSGTALSVKKQFPMIKVVLDLHENYPEGLKVWHAWKRNVLARIKNRLFMSYARWSRIEKEMVKSSDAVIAVVDEMKNKLTTNHGIENDKVTVITNTEELSYINQFDNPHIYGEQRSDFIIAYCGGIGPHRGVDDAILAMALLKEYTDIKLIISGYGSTSVMDYMSKLISANKLHKSVLLKGKVPFEDFYSLMKYASVNIIPHKKTGHTNNTIPHKIFQGMMSGKPLLVSDSDPLKRVVSNSKSGLIFEAGNPGDIARKVLQLYNNEKLCAELGSNGLNCTVNGSLLWENTSKSLITFYQTLNDEVRKG